VQRLYFNNVWASSVSNGVTLAPSNTATVTGVHFTELQANLNSGSGVTAAASGVSQVSFIGGNISQNAYGFYFNGPVPHLQIAHMNIGAFDNFSANTNAAITLSGGAFTDLQIVYNTFSGNGSTISGGANAGARSRIEANTGYNPVGASLITVGTSPYTHTAGPAPETVYITGGTVSKITVNGADVFTATEKTVTLAAKDTMTVTYSVAPTMVKDIH